MKWLDPRTPINKKTFSSFPVVQHNSAAGPQAKSGLQNENKTNMLLPLVEVMMWPTQKPSSMPGRCLAHSHSRKQKNKDRRLTSAWGYICGTRLNMMLQSSFCYIGKEEMSCSPVVTKIRPPLFLSQSTFVVIGRGLQISF